MDQLKGKDFMFACSESFFRLQYEVCCLIALVPHLKLRAEPEVDDDVLVELAPDVERGQHHGVHQEGDPHEERDDHAADPVERQHEEVVRRPTVKDPGDE